MQKSWGRTEQSSLSLSLQLLLSYSTTDSNLQGDLGNTPVMLASSTNNCEALRVLVRTRPMHSFIYTVDLYQPIKMTMLWHRKEYQPTSALFLTKDCLCLSVSPPISFLSKLQHGAKLCKQNKLGHFPIHAAAFAGAKQALEVILNLGMTKGIHQYWGHFYRARKHSQTDRWQIRNSP